MQTLLHTSLPPVTDLQPLFDRRFDVSPMEEAAATLEHAVAYLVTLNRIKRENVPANRQAVALLCEAAREVAASERREVPREHARGWLRAVVGH